MFFADRYPAWQRGNSENANGLSRQYLPRSMDFSTITDGDLRRVERGGRYQRTDGSIVRQGAADRGLSVRAGHPNASAVVAAATDRADHRALIAFENPMCLMQQTPRRGVCHRT